MIDIAPLPRQEGSFASATALTRTTVILIQTDVRTRFRIFTNRRIIGFGFECLQQYRFILTCTLAV